ncbi:class I SAM-dependent methyltransferase [Pyrobaculum sp.]|uniref:class I SAM-dependent methyltransferase n=1 Tax=Pyrobaculum sp. TaxID=2004705 RepID=UPI003D134D4D
MYGDDYFERRDVDKSEWFDIERALKALGVKKRRHRVLDVGGGTGDLARWLRGRGWLADYCDPHAPGAPYCRLPRDVPQADAYVLQHVLEHVEDPYGALAALLEKRPVAVVVVVPGHFSGDETHYCNHFRLVVEEEYEGAWGRARICTLYGLLSAARSRGYQAVWTVDTRSLYAPWDADFVVAVGRRIGRLAELRLKHKQYLAWLLFHGYG